MKLKVHLPVYCDQSVIQNAFSARSSNSFKDLQEIDLPDGNRSLKAKVIDAFNFVDHPKLIVDRAGTSISDFSCDCPDYRNNRSFCMHCAALALEFGADDQPIPTRNLDVEEVNADKPEVIVRFDEDLQDFSEESDPPELKDFSYSFANSSRDLYRGVANPRIPLERYKQVFGNHARARMLYQAAGMWGGSCFGIVATSTMLFQSESGINITDFDEYSDYPSELQLGDRNENLSMTLHEFIEAVHILQYCKPISYHRSANLRKKTCMKELCARVKAFQRGEADPVGMAVWKNPQMEDGHAVFPYRLEEISATEDKLYIYDPNWPLVTRFAFFEKNEQGQYINWRFQMNDFETYSSKTGGQLSFDAYEIYKKSWDNRGSSGVDNLLTVRPGISISDVAGTVLVRVTADGVVTYRDEIYQMPVTGKQDGSKKDTVIISIPVGSYVIRNEDPAQEHLSLQCTGFEQSVSIITTARQTVVMIDDESMTAYAAISEPNQQYSITLFSTKDGVEKDIKLEGTTDAEGIQFAQYQGVLFGKGISNASMACLCINGETISADRMSEYIHQMDQKEQPQNEDAELLTNTKPDETANDSDI